ncbi:MAG: CCA tRNA nucleotidyltransferase [Roseitalea sp.]|jgi:poly(A) polymerase|nr:CCA tRNA nucleotidyltransferase [Roseitalea sp.]MBO6723091.1 CCA tRNA nucleotidyltransferase [Roseitalea sp.]MBO6742471.1 CCA tRNA nucleotidyltransferase [Roseitalea sp.]
MSAGRLDTPWLNDPGPRRLLALLGADGEEARIVGGAIRNTLTGQPVTDIDIATTCPPGETMRRLQAADIKAVDTGMEHGTVTAVIDGHGYEITTLREDVETDGRRAVVRFGRSWQHDAERRDFTINALYAEADGTLVDLVGARADIEARLVRFIGDPEQRIAEDCLRILRFFRFFAWYGRGRPDAEGLKACARLKDGVRGLSAERIWAEMRKLLAAPDPSRALLWMRQAGVLSLVLPESEKWGIDGIHALMAAERALGWQSDAVLRLMTLIPLRTDVVETLCDRWKTGNRVRERLVSVSQTDGVAPDMATDDFERLLYEGDPQAISDRMRLDIAGLGPEDAGARSLVGLLDHAQSWTRPAFPVTGRDLMAQGFDSGPALGTALHALEKRWVESGFALDRDTLLADVPVPE